MNATRQQRGSSPGVTFQPHTAQAFQRGMSRLVDALVPTLGPLPRYVINQHATRAAYPELLDSGAVIARRIIQLPDRDEDIGAMFLRHMLWRLYETVGDGTTTAALLFRSVYNEGLAYLAAGGDAMRFRRHLEHVAAALEAALDDMAVQPQGAEQISAVVSSMCQDQALVRSLSNIFHVIGADGRIELQAGRTHETRYMVVESCYWDGGAAPELLQWEGSEQVQIEDAHVFISDLTIEQPRDMARILEIAVGAGCRSLLILAEHISSAALAVLLARGNRDLIRVVTSRLPQSNSYVRQHILDDLAMLTGGRPLRQAAGATVSSLQACDFGAAQRVWVDRYKFGIAGGRGDSSTFDAHLAMLRCALARTHNVTERDNLRERLGRLLPKSAILWVGGATAPEHETRQALAKRTVDALRGALHGGVVPGGGTALLRCQRVLDAQRQHAPDDIELRAVCAVLQRALEAPLRAILTNAGHEPGDVLSELRQRPVGHGFDVVGRQFGDMIELGIVDPLNVVKTALRGAIYSAALALTIDVVVHRANPPEVYTET